MPPSDSSPTEYILTFGYGNRKNYELFLDYLQRFDVKYVVDVRIRPRAWSRKWYGDQIHFFCNSNNIQYINKNVLGNTSGKENWIPPDQEQAEVALREIAEIARSSTVLLLCAEMNPNRCHRKDVADCLGKLASVPVKHLE